ncbi:MAG: hypothetical protein L0J42_05565 [Tetragenococcus koreensis]|nr:hypothetical protein [Tetragenococcus koreensis]
MKVEKWQNIDDVLVHDNEKAIICEEQDINDRTKINDKIQNKGKPVNETRKTMIKESVNREVTVDPLKVSSYFNKKNDNENAEKAKELETNQPTTNYKKIKNEITFFGQSFLEGFLDVYGLEVDNAVKRYEDQLHTIETYDLDNREQNFYIGRSKNGSLDLATDSLPTQKIAEEQINKFYAEPQKENKKELAQVQGRVQENEKTE